MSELADGSNPPAGGPSLKTAHISWLPTKMFLLFAILSQTVVLVAIVILYNLRVQAKCTTGDRLLIYCKHAIRSKEWDPHSWTLQSAVEYEVKSFTDSVARYGILPTTIYQGLSKEADDA